MRLFRMLALVFYFLSTSFGCVYEENHLESFPGKMESTANEAYLRANFLKTTQEMLLEEGFKGYEAALTEFSMGDGWQITLKITKKTGSDYAEVALSEGKIYFSLLEVEPDGYFSPKLMEAAASVFDFWLPFVFSDTLFDEF